MIPWDRGRSGLDRPPRSAAMAPGDRGLPASRPTNPSKEHDVKRTCRPAIAMLAILPLAAGCADQMLGNDRARDSISGSLGLPIADVTIVERRADGPTNTNFIVDTRANGRFVCTINGGNIATLGMTNGAACRRPGSA